MDDVQSLLREIELTERMDDARRLLEAVSVAHKAALDALSNAVDELTTHREFQQQHEQ